MPLIFPEIREKRRSRQAEHRRTEPLGTGCPELLRTVGPGPHESHTHQTTAKPDLADPVHPGPVEHDVDLVGRL